MSNLTHMFGKKTHARQFEDLVRPHLDHLYRVAYRFSGNACDAEDLVQDLIVKLYPKVGELAVIQQLRPWLARALYYHAIDNVRRKARNALDTRMEISTGDNDGDPLDSLPGHGHDPEISTEQSLTQERLHWAFSYLSLEHRAVVAMHDIEGYTLDELTHMLDAPIGTLKSRLHRARAHLRSLLLTMEPTVTPLRVIG